MLTVFTFDSFLPRHQSIGADVPLPVKMEVAVVKRMLPSSVIVLMAGLDVTVTSLGFPVRQLLAREVFLCSVQDDISNLSLCLCCN